MRALDARKQKKSDHLKYFHEHIMKLLNSRLQANSKAYEAQLDNKVSQLNAEKQSVLDALKVEHDNAMKHAELDRQKRISHLRYFHDHLIMKLKKYFELCLSDLRERNAELENQNAQIANGLNEQHNRVFTSLKAEKAEKLKEVYQLRSENKKLREDFDKTLSKEKLAELVKD